VPTPPSPPSRKANASANSSLLNCPWPVVHSALKRKEEYYNLKLINKVLAAYNNHMEKKYDTAT